ncbi:MAG: hypothetical protein AAF597_02020, partial [Bacteroidota bacterium]
MSKKTIYLIIGLITSAILGVILLQLDMIKTGMEVNEQRYNETLQDALRTAAREIEREEDIIINLEVDSRNSTNANAGLAGRTFSKPIQQPNLLSAPSLSSTSSLRSLIRAKHEGYDLVERFDASSLGTAIDKEFKDAQLEGDLEYGVYDRREDLFVIRNGRELAEKYRDTLYHKDLINSSYRVSLFEDHGWLMAYSPQKERVIFKSIGWNLLASLLFVA